MQTEFMIDWEWVKAKVCESEHINKHPKTASGILKSLDECMRLAAHMSQPNIASVNKRVIRIAGKSIKLEGGPRITGENLSSQIKGCHFICFFIATIGSDIEDSATMLMRTGEDLHGYLLDRIGSFAVESLAEDFEKKLRIRYRDQNLGVSLRYSPGYCDWPIKEQDKLDKAIGFSRVGVSLNDSLMMRPKKSISGLIAVGPADKFSSKKSQCSVCNIRKSCSYSRVKN